MSKQRDYASYRDRLLQDHTVKREYDRLQPQYELIRTIIDARINEGLTQEELAKRMGTKQTAISRIESGKGNPSLAFMTRLAEALGLRLKIQFTNPA